MPDMPPAASPPLTRSDRERFLAVWRSGRARSRRFFREIVGPDAYYERPIRLRNPFVFYDGHLPAFCVNTLVKRALGRPGVDEKLEVLFERGIDPEDEEHAGKAPAFPPRGEVEAYIEAADALVEETLATAPLKDASNPCLRRAQAVRAIIEHEPMHQETLLYMLHRLAFGKKHRPPETPPQAFGDPPCAGTVRIPAGRATLGVDPESIPFAWDNELPQTTVDVPSFSIDLHSVTNGDYLEFVESGGYGRRDVWTEADLAWREQLGLRHPIFWEQRDESWLWRGQFEEIPLPLEWPVYVSHAEASAYARWKGKRLPTEPEYHRAAFGRPEGGESAYPWGDAPPDPCRGNFGFERFDPVPAGSRPGGRSAWGVHDLVGNGWEWTSTPFGPFPGFTPTASYPVYSADFFDGNHWVMKGASPVTDLMLVRRSFRNWFQGRYPYPYAKFRLAGS